MQLILVRGLPGSGKSTFVRNNFPNILHLENDFYHYHNGKYEFHPAFQKSAVEWCLRTLDSALKCGMDVVVSNTYTRKQFIDGVKWYANKYKADFKVYRMTGDYGNIHSVPQDVLERMKSGFEDYEGEILV